MRGEQWLGRQPGAGAGPRSVETTSGRRIEGQKGWYVIEEDNMDLKKDTHSYAGRQAANQLSEDKRANWVEGVEYR